MVTNEILSKLKYDERLRLDPKTQNIDQVQEQNGRDLENHWEMLIFL